MIPKTYERSDDDKELKTVPVINQNKNDNYNAVSDSESKSNIEENPFEVDVNKEVKLTPQTTVNSKVAQAMKKLQASYDNDINEFFKKAQKHLNFSIDLAMVAGDPKSTKDESQTFNEA